MYEADDKKDYALGQLNSLREFYYGPDGFADWIKDKLLDNGIPLDPFDSSDKEYAVRRAVFMTYSELIVKVGDSLRNLNECYEADLKEAAIKK